MQSEITAHKRIEIKGDKYGYEQNNWNRFGNDKFGGCRDGRQRCEGFD
jgi:hypothetical protein